MERRNARSYLAWSIASTSTSTIERRTRINPHDCVKRRCGGSHQLAQAQRFLSAFGPIAGHFQPRRHRLSAREYRTILQDRFQQWNGVTGVKLVA